MSRFPILIAVALTMTIGRLGTSHVAAAENMGSSNYMLPLCKGWLKMVDRDVEEITRMIKRDGPQALESAGMCAGFVVGAVEALKMLEMTCPPDGVTNDQLVRMVIREAENHPEHLHGDFIVPTSAAIMATWPCKRR